MIKVRVTAKFKMIRGIELSGEFVIFPENLRKRIETFSLGEECYVILTDYTSPLTNRRQLRKIKKVTSVIKWTILVRKFILKFDILNIWKKKKLEHPIVNQPRIPEYWSISKLRR